jgi:hypothetical protein
MNPQMLHPEMLQQIKDKYKAHLHTDQGKEDLRIAVEQKRMWMLQKQEIVMYVLEQIM